MGLVGRIGLDVFTLGFILPHCARDLNQEEVKTIPDIVTCLYPCSHTWCHLLFFFSSFLLVDSLCEVQIQISLMNVLKSKFIFLSTVSFQAGI